MKIRNLAYLLLVILIFNSCSKVPITGRRQLKMVPDYMMMDMSLTSYKEFLSKNPAMPASNNDVVTIRKVGGKLSTAIAAYLKKNNQSKRIQGFAWEYNLVQSSDVNAWCMPGGKIVFYTGILPYTKNEAGIAVVMGHEIAHAIAKHGNERMSQQLALTLGGIAITTALEQKPEETKNIFLAVYGVGSTLGTLAYSRKHELEADKLGMVFMALAGYDPEECIGFWQRMSAAGGAKVPQLISTHPSDENRVKELKAFLPQAKKYYQTVTK